ncbi:MAG: VWA domain-containing protein [Pseudomonadota bacterium]
MRGQVLAARQLLLLSVLVFGAAPAAAEDLVAPALQSTIIVVDGSQSMNETIGPKQKMNSVRSALSRSIAIQGDRRPMGLVAFGHRKASDCSDIEGLAQPGTLKGATAQALLDKIQPAGEAPIAAAVEAATKLGTPGQPLNVILVSDGQDSCKADPCAAAQALKQQHGGLRIHVVGLSAEPQAVEPLACMAASTGGKFVAATNEAGFEVALGAVFAAIDTPAARPAAMLPQMPPRTSAAPAKSRTIAPGASAVSKSGGPNTVNTAESIIEVLPPEPVPEPPAQPVPVSFHAQATEGGARLRSGLIWRVFNAQANDEGGFELISTHREAAPSMTLLPGEYLVNAAYGLSNLTKKVKVDSANTNNETFVLNTGGLMVRAVLANGQEGPEGEVEFDIQSDERDQFGKRETILADAKPKKVVRLNAGAYHIKSLYGDANANVGVDVTIEPGRITQATIKHTGAKITFRLVQSRGGEALTDTKWQILTSAGDTVKSAVGALPTHILAAGNYAVIAENGGKSYSRKFVIEPGNDKQIEVAIEDGPTSAKELQVLLEPPEAPRPGTSGYAGPPPAGAFGVDGFSNPADPNGPLLNPGALLRPSR